MVMQKIAGLVSKKEIFFLLNMKLRKIFVPVHYLKYIHTVKSFAAEGILPIEDQKKSIPSIFRVPAIA